MKLGGRGILLAAVSVVVACVVVVGFVMLGSPGEARKQELDRRRIEALRDLSNGIINWAADHGHEPLPTTLEAFDLRGMGKPRTSDPSTGIPYRYRVLGQRRFELCATFETVEQDKDLEEWERSWAHPAGSHCFQFDVYAGRNPRPISP